jgi:hypothetical protein
MIENERIKLTANWLNGLAIATYAVGGIAPILTSFYSGNEPSSPLAVALVSGVCFAATGALHFAARRILGGLRP